MDERRTEITSIMFEMKNETIATKRRGEDFFMALQGPHRKRLTRMPF
jgi:hypothetical protein